MATAGFSTALRTPVGAATAIADEPTTVVTANTVYQVTASTKRILDPNTALTVKVNGVAADPSTFSVDYLFGRVTFAADQGAATVTISGAYLTTQALAEATSVSLALISDALEKTSFDSGGWKMRVLALQDWSADIEQLSSLLYDIDPGGGTTRMWDLLKNGTAFLLEVSIPGDTEVFRGWGRLSDASVKVAVAQLNTHPLKVEGAPVAGAGTNSRALAGFGTP